MNNPTASDEARAKASERLVQLNQQLRSLQSQQIDIARQEANLRRQSGEEQIRNAQRRLELEKGIIATATGALGDAAQRFASLSQKDQRRAVEAQKLAQSGRASELSREQRDLLASIGTQNATQAVRRADIADARQARFFQFFGQAERQQIAQAQAKVQQAQVTISDQTRFSIDVTSREQALVGALQKRMEVVLRDSNSRILQQFEERIRKNGQTQRDQLAQRKNSRPR